LNPCDAAQRLGDALTTAPLHALPATRGRIPLFLTFLCIETSGWIQLLVTTWLLLAGPNAASWMLLFLIARTAPKLVVAPLGGLLADRHDRLVLFRSLRLLAVLPPLGLALAAGGVVPLGPGIVVVAALGAVLSGLEQPARNGLIWDIGGRQRVFGVVSLDGAAVSAAGIVAPALAVLLAGTQGSATALVLAAFLTACAVLTLRRLGGRSQVRERPPEGDSALSGLRFVISSPRTLLLLLLIGAPGLAGRALAIVIPLLAAGQTSPVSGALVSAPGVGAFVAAMSLAALGDVADKGRLAVSCAALFAGSLSLASFTDSAVAGAALLALAGAGSAAFGSAVLALLHLSVPEGLRCRVIVF